MSAQQPVVVRTYRGNQASATEAFQVDAARLSHGGYYPISQSWAPGSYGCGAFLVALLLCFIFIGVLVFVYMLVVKPDGTLTVTYEVRAASSDKSSLAATEEKTCPRCAEHVKAAAVVCRFCGYEFN